MVWFSPNSTVFSKSINMAPPQADLVQQGCSNIWRDQRASHYHQTIGRPVPSPYQKHPTFCGTYQVFKLQEGECMIFYDVKALFTSVLADPAISTVKSKLLQDPLLPQRISASIQQIITLQELCLKNTYFHFKNKYFKLVHVVTMGLPISPLIANLSTEGFEHNAISSAPNPPILLLNYVDFTFVIQQLEHDTSSSRTTLCTPTYSLLWKIPKTLGPYPSWIPLFPLNPTITL